MWQRKGVPGTERVELRAHDSDFGNPCLDPWALPGVKGTGQMEIRVTYALHHYNPEISPQHRDRRAPHSHRNFSLTWWQWPHIVTVAPGDRCPCTGSRFPPRERAVTCPRTSLLWGGCHALESAVLGGQAPLGAHWPMVTDGT